jgi:hypothetical protein
MGSIQQRAASAPPRVRRIHEKEEQLALRDVNGAIADDTMRGVDRDQKRIGRRMVANQLIPVLRREHRPSSQLTKERPALTHSRVEHRADRRSVLRDRASQRELACGHRINSVHGLKDVRSQRARRRGVRVVDPKATELPHDSAPPIDLAASGGLTEHRLAEAVLDGPPIGRWGQVAGG